MDVILTECNLSLHEITSVFQSAVIFMSCRIMKFKICIFRQHFFVNANFIKHNRHFMSTYFLLDPFEFPYYFYCILGELIYVLSIVACIPSTFCPTLGHHQGRIYYKSDVTFVLAYYNCVRASSRLSEWMLFLQSVICLFTRSRLYSKVLLYL